MKIVVGLGNPGEKYRNTKHNIGFMVIDRLSERHGIRVSKAAYTGLYGYGKIGDAEVMLFKPMTYMNLSGQAVSSVNASLKENNEGLLIVADDLNIPIGSLRLRENGTAGGHNGLRSIIEHMGEEFARLRLGIGAEFIPDDKASFVLADFDAEEAQLLEEEIEKAADCVEVWAQKGAKAAMDRFNK
jgi:PTH1 family peptidyl-tRNA hydrolase